MAHKMMNLRHRYILPFILLSVTLSAAAAPRTRQQAKAIADSVAHSLNLQLPQNGAARVKAKTDEVSSYYVFNNANAEGFTIVSGDDQLPDVVGFTTSGSFDADNMPDALSDFLSSYEDMVTSLTAGDVLSATIATQAKARLAAPATAIAPLVTATWNQSAPYNNQCPVYSSGQRSVTGCVATAMAQILYYYGSKVSLHTQIPAYTTYSYDISVPAIAATTYDWDNMLASYSNSYSSTQAAAVAKLMYHCGASVQMDYGPSSGASDAAACNALVDYFGMDQQLVSLVSRDKYSYAEWVNLLDNELESARPVLYTGVTPESEGHAFVCDGRNSKGYYHINWGWGGYYDGYFDLTVLRPSGQGIGGSQTQDASFAGENSMIIGITPDNGVTDSPLIQDRLTVTDFGAELPTLTITSGTRASADEAFTGSVTTYLINVNSSSINRLVSLGILDSDGQITKISNDAVNVSLNGQNGAGFYALMSYDIPFTYAFPIGKTRIYVIESSDGGNTWKTCYGQDDYPFQIAVSETTMSTFTSNLYATVHALAPVSGTSNTVIVKLHNDSAVEYNGAIEIRESVSSQPSTATSYYSDNVYIPAFGTKTIAIPSYENTANQKYYFVLNKSSKVLGTGTTGTLGDVNKKDGVDKSDIQSIADFITGKLTVTDDLDIDAADLDGDGDVDVTDIVKMIKALNGK